MTTGLREKLLENIRRQITAHLASPDKWLPSWWRQLGVMVDTEDRLKGNR
jgi:hypothetical protein